MTKLCPRGKAAAKRKFRVYPSAYANAYASKICAGKIKDPSGVKRKDFRGSKAEGGPVENNTRFRKLGPGKRPGTKPSKPSKSRKSLKTIDQERQMTDRPIIKFPRLGAPKSPIPRDPTKPLKTIGQKLQMIKASKPSKPGEKMKEPISPTQRRNEGAAMKRESRLSTKIRGYNERVKRAGGGLMEATARLKRQGLKGGGICTKGMNRDAVGKNS